MSYKVTAAACPRVSMRGHGKFTGISLKQAVARADSGTSASDLYLGMYYMVMLTKLHRTTFTLTN